MMCVLVIFSLFQIGIAVGDIDKIQKQAYIKRIGLQVRYLIFFKTRYELTVAKIYRPAHKMLVLIVSVSLEDSDKPTQSRQSLCSTIHKVMEYGKAQLVFSV